jgi:hypothetical protein
MSERELHTSSTAELEQLTRDIIDELAGRPNPDAFLSLLALSGHVGERIGTSAQQLSTTMSWAQIGDLAGTSRQNAWARWNS